jgi:hypothetical protein
MSLGRGRPAASAWSASALRGTPTRADRREVKAFLRRSSAERTAPLFVFGAAGYDPVEVQRGPEGNPCRILVRPRAGRCFHADPSLADSPASTGRPRRHGPKMNCADPSTWPKPCTQCTRARTPGLRGSGARASPGANLHPKARTRARRSSRGPLPIVVGTLVLAEVEWLPRGERRREPRILWLWWHRPEGEAPNLGLLWRAYVRPFDLEHTFRLLEQALGWTTPRVRHPGQADTGRRGRWWPPSPGSGWRGRALRIGGRPGSVTTTPAA